jgi:hypothetical protein
MSKKTISSLMKMKGQLSPLDFLLQSLPLAVELEFSTIPVYLCGMWSIQEQQGAVYDLINSIVIEEMLHMGLASNMLNAIGGQPEIDAPGFVPTYPGPLPGDVRPQLTVALTGLSTEVVANMFMQIEYPEGGPIALRLGKPYPTIGAFYDAIADAFGQLTPAQITGANQLTSQGLGLFAITCEAEAIQAITLIKEQGEGTSQSPYAGNMNTGEFAHYYKFAEIYHGQTLVQGASGEWDYTGDPIPFPAVYPVAQVPAGGYPQSHDFDVQFTQLISQLQTAWAQGSQDALGDAIGTMYNLYPLAQTLMQTPLPGGGGNYAPDFRVASS